MNPDISLAVQEKAVLILAEIKKAKSILLHCHPSPDPDSVGSALAMKFALEQIGKKATVIKGDSEFPAGFRHFPRAGEIVEKSFFEIDLKEFDLFIVLDSARIEMVSRRGKVEFPETLKAITIDHHLTNGQFGSINLVDPSYPATCQLLFDLFHIWEVKITPEIASNLFIGMYTDTGGFKYLVNDAAKTYRIAAYLVSLIPDVSKLILMMENSEKPDFLFFEAEALGNIEIVGGGKVALSFVPLSYVKEKNISINSIRVSDVAVQMLTVAEWEVVASAVEIEPNKIKFSFRSKNNGEKYDVAALTAALGGGGHRAAAGLILEKPYNEAKKVVVEKMKEMYNL